MAAPSNVPYLRTPDSRFSNLPDFPYMPKYIQYGDLRMAYIDESSGPSDGEAETYLCLHGQPTWSYLYRHMIPVLLHHTTKSNSQPARRVIAPDLLGFGRSDKPIQDFTYTYAFHRSSLIHFVTALDLTNIALVVQDWGGLLGLTLPHELPSRFSRLLVMNTFIATGQTPTQGFRDWLAFSNRNPDMKVGELMRRSCMHLTKAEADAYDAPFPGVEFKGGVRRFPQLVMISPEMDGVDVSRRAMEFYKSSGKFRAEDVLMVCGMKDPVLGPPVMKNLAGVWGDGCFYTEIAEAGHFVQEWGGKVARLAIEVFERDGEVEGTKKVASGKARL